VLGARLLLVAAVVVWGSTFVATRICLAHLDPVTLVGLRFAIGLPLLGALVLGRRTRLAFGRREMPWLAAGMAIFGLHFLIQVAGLQYTTASRTGWIIAITPLVIAVLASRWLGESTGPRLWTGIAIATVGLLLLVSNGSVRGLGGLRGLGDALVLVSTATWALYTLATRDLSRARDPLAVSFYVTLPLALIGVAVVVPSAARATLPALPGPALAALLFLGTLGTLAQWFWQIGIARIGAARAGVFLYLEPLVTTALAVPLLGERLGPVALAGGVLVLLGVGWAERRPAQRPGPAATTRSSPSSSTSAVPNPRSPGRT
jgi:drug/metabolite transporter (DMT)-like permease